MSVVEAMIAIAVFSLIASVCVQAFAVSNALTLRTAEKTKALWLAEEGIEATRSIRDTAFSGLTPGAHGLSAASNSWQFSGTSDVTEKYYRTVTITSLTGDSVMASSSVSWNTKGATSTVMLASQFTNWRKAVGTQASHVTANVTGADLLLPSTVVLSNMTFSTDGIIGTTTLTKVTVAWTPTTPTSIKLQSINIPNNTPVYTGTQSSGVTVTLPTPVVLVGPTSQGIQVLWNQSVLGKSFTITYTFSDGSALVSTITNPPAGL